MVRDPDLGAKDLGNDCQSVARITNTGSPEQRLRAPRNSFSVTLPNSQRLIPEHPCVAMLINVPGALGQFFNDKLRRHSALLTADPRLFWFRSAPLISRIGNGGLEIN